MFKPIFLRTVTILTIISFSLVFSSCGGRKDDPGDKMQSGTLSWVEPLEVTNREFAVVSGELSSESIIDFDRDGDFDLVPIKAKGGTVTWYENNPEADEYYQPHVLQTPFNDRDYRNSVKATDLDGDGDLDLLSISLNGGLQWLGWFENQGGSSPEFEWKYIEAEPFQEFISLASDSIVLEDLNGDELIDIAVISHESDEVLVYLNAVDEQNRFNVEAVTSFEKSLNFLAAADVDLDGDIDFLCNENRQHVVWLINDGAPQPSFVKSQVFSFENENWLHKASVDDFDTDGDIDIAGVTVKGHIVVLDSVSLEARSHQKLRLSNESTSATLSNLQLRDLDLDGDNEFSWVENGKVYIAENVSRGAINFEVHQVGLLESDAPYQVIGLVDFDEDGDIDILSRNFGTASGLPTDWFEKVGGSATSFNKVDVDTNGASLSNLFVKNNLPEFISRKSGSGYLDTPFLLSGTRLHARTHLTTPHKVINFSAAAQDINGAEITYSLEVIDDYGSVIQASIDGTTGDIQFLAESYRANKEENIYRFKVTASTVQAQIERHVSIEVVNDDFDDDNDGISDDWDLFPLDAKEFSDADMDGIGDSADADDDNDGVADVEDELRDDAQNISAPDWAGSGVSNGDYLQLFSDVEMGLFIDVDGDGDEDLVSNKVFLDGVAFLPQYINRDGFYNRRLVAMGDYYVLSMYPMHFGADSDMDFAAVDRDDNENKYISIYEFENIASPKLNRRVVGESIEYLENVIPANFNSTEELEFLYNTSGSKRDHLAIRTSSSEGNRDIVVEEKLGVARNLIVVDFDQDGDNDILGYFPTIQSLVWYENDDLISMRFKRHIIKRNINSNYEIKVDDLDSDGDLDLIAASNGKLIIMENYSSNTMIFVERGSSDYAANRLISYGYTFLPEEDIVIMDYDKDGDKDILYNRGPLNFGVLENLGQSRLSFSQEYRDMGTQTSILASVNPLGAGTKKVLLTTTTDGNFIWLSSNISRHHVKEGEGLTVDLVASDEDGDLLNYALAHGADAHLNNIFSVSDLNKTLTISSAPGFSSPLDADQNNIYEIWLRVSDSSASSYRKFEFIVTEDDNDDDDDGVEDEHDAFPNNSREYVDTDGDGVGNFADDDDDGDGVPDWDDEAPLNPLSSKNPIWDNTMTPVSEHHQVFSEVRGYPNTYAGDLNLDGLQDFLISASEGLSFHKNLSESAFDFEMSELTSMSLSSSVIAIADMDLDTDNDIVLVNNPSGTIYWVENLGINSLDFRFHTIGHFNHYVRPLRVADLNADGWPDIVAGVATEPALQWLENKGGSSIFFVNHSIPVLRDEIDALEIADVDGDGDLDIFSASKDYQTISWLENNGLSTPQFKEHVISTARYSERMSLKQGDINGDGLPDLVIINSERVLPTWLMNRGGSPVLFEERRVVFSDAPSSSWPKFRGALDLIDMDFDGDLDIVSGSKYRYEDSPEMAWYENVDGLGGSFKTHFLNLEADDLLYSRGLFDFNGDGFYEFLAVKSGFDVGIYNMVDRRISVAEGEKFVSIESATDPDGNSLSYSISGGSDAAYFEISALTGELFFKDTAPPTKAPLDNNSDNRYTLIVSVTDGSAVLNRLLEVEVIAE